MDARPLPLVMAEAYGGSLEPGARGGVVVPGTTLHVAFDPWSDPQRGDTRCLNPA